MNLALQPVAQVVRRDVQVVINLQPEPELRGVAKETRQPQGSISRDAAFAEHNFVDPARVDANAQGKAVLVKAQRLQEFFLQNFAR